MSSRPLLREELSDRTAGLWVVISICLGAAFVVVILLVSLWLACRRRPNAVPVLPVASEEIQEISVVEPSPQPSSVGARSLGEILRKPLPSSGPLSSAAAAIDQQGLLKAALEVGHRGGGEGLWSAVHPPEVSNLGWGNWYALRELQVATNMFADENVIGEGGCGIVYIGVLQDNTQVAVKNLLNNRGQAEREFKVEVEAIGRARHKNLVRLLGYCAEGDHRILVYEYVNNGNLDQWLHGDVGSFSPLTWAIRMNIILGTAKGMMYLHEGLEPKVVHRDIKSSNILIDKHWNAKVSDFGLAKLLWPERSYVTTRVMGTFGYVAPEYATTGMLNERSDVYSFGVLIMEIISGRNPIDYSRPPGEVNLVEWIKIMVSNHNSEGVLDPKLCEKPSSRALKRALLVALRCIDADSQKRPRMGQVIHMLEVADFPYRDEQGAVQTYKDIFVEKAKLLEMVKSQDSTSRESNTDVKKPLRWKKQDN